MSCTTTSILLPVWHLLSAEKTEKFRIEKHASISSLSKNCFLKIYTMNWPKWSKNCEPKCVAKMWKRWHLRTYRKNSWRRPIEVLNLNSNYARNLATGRKALPILAPLETKVTKKSWKQKHPPRNKKTAGNSMTMTIAVVSNLIMMWICSWNRRFFTLSSWNVRCRSLLTMNFVPRVNSPLLMNRSKWRRTTPKRCGKRPLLSSPTNLTSWSAHTQTGFPRALKCSCAMAAWATVRCSKDMDSVFHIISITTSISSWDWSLMTRTSPIASMFFANSLVSMTQKRETITRWTFRRDISEYISKSWTLKCLSLSRS